MAEEIDLYDILSLPRSASKAEIKKAYHKAALSSHPDKVPETERATAEIRFKAVSQAYEILYDDDKREVYDRHGMSAFDGSRPGGMPGEGVDLDDILQQMFGMGMGGGMPGMGGMPGGMGGGRKVPRRGKNEEQEYEVTLEELYKGKTTRFASTKNVVCTICKGSGGKEKAKPHTCGVCKGQGTTTGLRSIAPGLVTQETTTCGTCKGVGTVYKDKDRCKKCKGQRVVETRKVLEVYIPPGSREGDKVVLSGEADQLPDQEPGDIVFTLKEDDHPVFKRVGADLMAPLNVTLAEALTGFNRVVLKHLDGRGIQLNVHHSKGKVLRPGQVLKVKGEGMPIKRSDTKGDLYLIVEVDFPEDGWIRDEATMKAIKGILPDPAPEITAETIDEVEYEFDADIDDMGADSDDPRGGAAWEDDDEDEEGGTQCAQQ
ncbi:DnaJ-domain-containing protein [Patellaria atrata CBS 101060]|uniref:DnaJ-domain-containing protein n=1 Tax=Patellaria atrata CBS 101060 TaxID=1346257 RepID=A0A9P4S5J4_9PEZI|nr:DnaJ-domain-containing protein [Patellaria atrata CBS 101060]